MYTDGASAQGADLKYGLNYGGAAPQALQKDNRWPARGDLMFPAHLVLICRSEVTLRAYHLEVSPGREVR